MDRWPKQHQKGLQNLWQDPRHQWSEPKLTTTVEAEAEAEAEMVVAGEHFDGSLGQ